jgi:hypothetical protein
MNQLLEYVYESVYIVYKWVCIDERILTVFSIGLNYQSFFYIYSDGVEFRVVYMSEYIYICL